MKSRIIIATGLLCLSAAVTAWLFYPEKAMPPVSVDHIIVYKARRQMLVFNNGTLLKTYSIALGKNPVGKKQYEGDFKTPEGAYTIYAKNPNSAYHKNLGISYPNATDEANAILTGKPAGGDIKIHGCNKKLSFIGRVHRHVDWTHGCIALTDEEIDELYAQVQVGTRININPKSRSFVVRLITSLITEGLVRVSDPGSFCTAPHTILTSGDI